MLGIEVRMAPCYNDFDEDIMSQENFEVVEHTADWSIHVRGRNLAEMFCFAAEGMSTLMAGGLDQLPLDIEREVALSAVDVESLLVDWLSELAFWAEMEQLVFRSYDILEVGPTQLKAVVRGGRADILHKHIKAVTYHELQVRQTEAGFETTIVFDV